jgi:hypothetical protein
MIKVAHHFSCFASWTAFAQVRARVSEKIGNRRARETGPRHELNPAGAGNGDPF